MSLRGEWEFTVPAPELRKCAAEKVEHHRDRLKHYQDRAQEKRDAYIASVEKAAREATDFEREQAADLAAQINLIDYHDHSNRMSSSTVLPQAPQVQGDPKLRQELQQAEQKIQEHTTKITTFEMWVELLAREDQETTRTLHIDDAHFFGL